MDRGVWTNALPRKVPTRNNKGRGFTGFLKFHQSERRCMYSSVDLAVSAAPRPSLHASFSASRVAAKDVLNVLNTEAGLPQRASEMQNAPGGA